MKIFTVLCLLAIPSRECRAGELLAVSQEELSRLAGQAQRLEHKAQLLKAAADKKYANAAQLQEQANQGRYQAGEKAQELQRKAAQSIETAETAAGIFDLAMGVTGSNKNSFLASSTQKLIQSKKKSGERQLAYAQQQEDSLNRQGDRQAAPLEQKASAVEEEGNKLMEAFSDAMDMANARYLLIASEKLRQRVAQDRQWIKEISQKQTPQ